MMSLWLESFRCSRKVNLQPQGETSSEQENRTIRGERTDNQPYYQYGVK